MHVRALLPNLLAASLAGSALAQSPTVEVRLLACSAGSDIAVPFALPDGASIRNFLPVGSGGFLIATTDSRMFVSDGHALTQVCTAGTQIPGQPAGTLWRSLLGDAYAIPREGGGLIFYAGVTIPGVGDVYRTVAGDALSGDPIAIGNPGAVRRATRTGLIARRLAAGEVRLGVVGGTEAVAIPPNLALPGLAGTISTWSSAGPRLNAEGIAAGDGTTTANESFGATFTAEGLRSVIIQGQTVHTDRGSFTLTGGIVAQCQPMDDGSAIWSASAGPNQRITWTAGPNGDGPILALAGDPAPGCPAGFTVQQPQILAVSGNGLIVWGAHLLDNGAPAGSALYLRRAGRDRLILRSGTPIAGAPDEAPAPSFDPETTSASALCIGVNRAGTVAMLSGPSIPDLAAGAACLYTPEAGTVEITRLSGTLSPAPLSGEVRSLFPATGTFSNLSVGAYSASPDADRCPLLDESGTLVFAGSLNAAVSRTFGAAARLTSPGCRPDYNADGFLDFFDYMAFVDCFEGGACPNGKDADFNNDDFADFFDFIDFVDAFEHGC